jgi:hypothetical protein
VNPQEKTECCSWLSQHIHIDGFKDVSKQRITRCRYRPYRHVTGSKNLRRQELFCTRQEQHVHVYNANVDGTREVFVRSPPKATDISCDLSFRLRISKAPHNCAAPLRVHDDWANKSHTYIHTHTHTYTHARTRTHTHTHMKAVQWKTKITTIYRALIETLIVTNSTCAPSNTILLVNN